jgi:Amt family ammonium transporter
MKNFIKVILLYLLFPCASFAGQELVIDTGNTTWVIISSILVMIMTPGLAFFYSGMVSNKNVVSTIMHSYLKLCSISIIWVLWGYSLSFGDSLNGIIGNLKYIGFQDVINTVASGTDIPHSVFALFQGMFAVITVAIITGSFAERVRLAPMLIFSAIWITFVYAPVAHWVWGGGWIHTMMNPLDFAGGAVVHINSAIAGLVAAIYLGKRVECTYTIKAHNIPLTILGACLLWFGWFGFNAGSALSSGQLAGLALLNTNLAAAAGALGWFVIEAYRHKQTSAIGIISGSIAGLVAITPAAGYITPIAAIVTGFLSGLICYWAVTILKPKLGYDDSLDAFGIHGIGGLWGAIATGLFATIQVNESGANGLFYGETKLFFAQIFSSLIVILYSAIMTFVILKILRSCMNIRVSIDEEKEGLDKSLHGERGYSINN